MGTACSSASSALPPAVDPAAARAFIFAGHVVVEGEPVFEPIEFALVATETEAAFVTDDRGCFGRRVPAGTYEVRAPAGYRVVSPTIVRLDTDARGVWVTFARGAGR